MATYYMTVTHPNVRGTWYPCSSDSLKSAKRESTEHFLDDFKGYLAIIGQEIDGKMEVIASRVVGSRLLWVDETKRKTK